MIEYNFINKLITRKTRENLDESKSDCVKICDKPEMTVEQTYMLTTVMILYLILYIWAFLRAISVRKNKASHVLLAIVSPTLYLVLSYFLEDF